MPLESIEDKSVKIKPNETLLHFIWDNVKNLDNAPSGIVQLKKAKSNNEEISDITLKLEDVRWLMKFLEEYRKNSEVKRVYLHELLKDATVILPVPKVTPRNPELEARVQKLIAEQNAKEYAAMTKYINISRKGFAEDTISYQIKQINRQLIAVAQFVFSVLAGFAFGFIGVELLVGNLDFGFRLLLGIICALIIALAEIYFLAIKLNEDGYDVTSSSTKRKLHQE